MHTVSVNGCAGSRCGGRGRCHGGAPADRGKCRGRGAPLAGGGGGRGCAGGERCRRRSDKRARKTRAMQAVLVAAIALTLLGFLGVTLLLGGGGEDRAERGGARGPVRQFVRDPTRPIKPPTTRRSTSTRMPVTHNSTTSKEVEPVANLTRVFLNDTSSNFSADAANNLKRNSKGEHGLKLSTDRKTELLNKSYEYSSHIRKMRSETLRPCHLNINDYGPMQVDKADNCTVHSYPWVEPGGSFRPVFCEPLHTVAVILPFRAGGQNKEYQRLLDIFVTRMHPFLSNQLLEYRIFVIEQYGSSLFNRGMLLNVGFLEAQKERPSGWDCLIFHDLDLLPLDSRNLYNCHMGLTHMSVAIDKFDYKDPDETNISGVLAMKAEQFKALNGFSNRYYGWGGEDLDLYKRILAKKLPVSRPLKEIGRYVMLDHKEREKSLVRNYVAHVASASPARDGLSSLNYTALESRLMPLYTLVRARLD